MSTVAGREDEIWEAKVQKVVRVAWSRRSCWHGDDVKLHIRTEHVPDGVAAKVRILAADGTTVIDELTGQIAGGKLDLSYVIDWRDKPVPRDSRLFVFTATLADKLVSEASDPLLVDLEPPVFSL